MTTYLNGEAMLHYNECLTGQHEDCLTLLVLVKYNIFHARSRNKVSYDLKRKNNKLNHFNKTLSILRPYENLGTSDNYGLSVLLLIGYPISKRKMVNIDWLVWYRPVYWCHFNTRKQTNKQKTVAMNCSSFVFRLFFEKGFFFS